MRRTLILPAVFVIAHVAGVRAQDLMTTPIGFRTGFTEGAVTTRPGSFTLDVGASTRWSSGTTTYRVGEFSLRAPVSGRVEARLYGNSYAWRKTPQAAVTGREDLSVALAAMVLTHSGVRPVAALILRLDTPTGTLPGREHSWRPSARWSLGWELPGRIALHCNLGIASETLASERFSREFASLWVSRRIAGPVGAYGEVYGSSRERPGGGATSYLHGGLTYLIRPWIHVDLHGGLGSQRAGSPRWAGIGVRQRI
jgi:hypothetical protein